VFDPRPKYHASKVRVCLPLGTGTAEIGPPVFRLLRTSGLRQAARFASASRVDEGADRSRRLHADHLRNLPRVEMAFALPSLSRP
jgi:hypothetical protein